MRQDIQLNGGWTMEYKPNVVFDFDGVIHSYAHGWKGITAIPDSVVPGIAEAIYHLRSRGYRVVVVSTRCVSEDGLEAVRKYLAENEIEVDAVQMEKPPALCYIDDRAIRFDGHPEKLVDQVMNFHSWLEGPTRNDEPVKGLRPCKAVVYEKGEAVDIVGRYHCWGNNYEEFDGGPGVFTTAIIELDDGRIVSCPAETVRSWTGRDQGR